MECCTPNALVQAYPLDFVGDSSSSPEERVAVRTLAQTLFSKLCQDDGMDCDLNQGSPMARDQPGVVLVAHALANVMEMESPVMWKHAGGASMLKSCMLS